MNFNNSALEMLAAFAVVFVTTAVSAIGLLKYIEKIRRDAHGAHEAW